MTRVVGRGIEQLRAALNAAGRVVVILLKGDDVRAAWIERDGAKHYRDCVDVSRLQAPALARDGDTWRVVSILAGEVAEAHLGFAARDVEDQPGAMEIARAIAGDDERAQAIYDAAKAEGVRLIEEHRDVITMLAGVLVVAYSQGGRGRGKVKGDEIQRTIRHYDAMRTRSITT